MSLAVGKRLGAYEIVALIGAGGMGEVYRARDTRLKRDVALKVLPAALADDADRLARFQREAEVLAALNHAHIAQLYGLEDSNDAAGVPTRALVMELVEGVDLSQRIARGPLPLEEAVSIARQIADALGAAHEQGIIHRDLKPANIKLRRDGTVKVLDFGLAKAVSATTASDVSTESNMITSPAKTTLGIILGTTAYMPPEQARGHPVDRRADIWAFGAILYEMLTAQRAFEGADLSETIAAVVSLEPDWAALPGNTPQLVRRLLRRCLDKDRKRRLDSAAALQFDLEEAVTGSASDVRDGPKPIEPPLSIPLWVAVASIVALLATLGLWSPWRGAPLPPETRVDIVTPATGDPASFALSPDGRQVVFVASHDDVSYLWLRSLATTSAQPLTGTEGASFPFWSPDGRSVAFFAATALKRLDLDGGTPQTLSSVTNGSGGTWNANGAIVFAPSTTSGLMRVSASGGATAIATPLGPHHVGHVAPHFLPDGQQFLFYAQGVQDTTGIYLGALDGRTPIRLAASDSAGVYLPTGWLLLVRAGNLVAQRLDVAKAETLGDAATLATGVVPDRFRSAVSVAATGVIAYRTGIAKRQLVWRDRSGAAHGNVGTQDGTLVEPRVSPDGQRVVVSRTAEGNQDLWLLDGSRTSRFTFDTAADRSPAWSPDGRTIAFHSSRTGIGDLYVKLTTGARPEERLVASDQLKAPGNWSADGALLLYHSVDPPTDLDLWVVPTANGRAPSIVLKTPFRESYPMFSPDSRWVAYQSNESGQYEVYVRPFIWVGTAGAATEGQWQVSTSGGIHPVWGPNGKELYYLDPTGAMMAASITPKGPHLDVGTPVRLFAADIVGGGGDAQQRRQYDVGPDGRFLINTIVEDISTPITLLMNWRPPTP